MTIAVFSLIISLTFFSTGQELKTSAYTAVADTADDFRPGTIHEAVFYLNETLPERDLESIRETDEASFVGNALTGDGLGRWIIEEWELWKPGRLHTFFNRNQISQPLEMAEVILTSLHRYLNNRPMHINQQMEQIRAFWEDQEKGLEKGREEKDDNGDDPDDS